MKRSRLMWILGPVVVVLVFAGFLSFERNGFARRLVGNRLFTSNSPSLRPIPIQANCTYSLSSSGQSFSSAGGTGTVNVTATKSAGLGGQIFTEAVGNFRQGEVFAAVGNGKVKRFSQDGTLIQTLDSGSNASYTTGMAFDKAGNLFVTQFSGNSIYKFDITGTLIGAFGTGYDSAPESIVIDQAQNIYVGHADGARLVRKFNQAGTLLDTYAAATESRGTDWVDLAADQKTLYYTSEGGHIKRYDLSTKTALPDFNATALPGSFAYALRILPGGGVIVADTQTIIRLDSTGKQVQTYDATGQDNWFAVNLDSDGQSFWSGDLTTGKVFHFDIASGNVLASWDSGQFTSLAGLAVFGEITASQVLRVSKSAPSSVAAGDQLTYTLSYGNTGNADATNVVIKDSIPANTSFVSATNGGSYSGGVVTWNIGTVTAGSTGKTVSYTVAVSGSLAAGSIITNSTYTIEASGVSPVAGAPVTTSVTAGATCNWTAVSNASWISVTSGTPGTDNGTVGFTVAANTTNSSRTGTITIAGLTYTITQAGACTYNISPTSQAYGADGGNGNISVTVTKPSLQSGLPATEAASSFRQGEVFAAVGQGKVNRFSPDGTLLQTLNSGSGSQETAGMAFDKSGNFYSTQFQASSIYKFDIYGNLIGAFGTGFDTHPESIIFDLAQNIYVGHADGSRLVRKFNLSGTLLDTYNPATENRGTDWIDLAADQKTLYYTSEDGHVKRYDISTKTQLGDFNPVALPGNYAYALRILPGGGVIVADTQTIIRLDAAGNQVQTYDAPGQDNWFAVNLDSDGQTFWSGDQTTGKIYRFNLASGNIITSFDSAKFTSLAGLAVFGEITASQVLRVSKTAPSSVAAGAQMTYTLSYGNTGTSDATSVVIKDTVPANTSFVSADNGGTYSNGVVTWNVGTVAAGVTGRTVSYTVAVSSGLSGGAVITNSTYTIEAAGVSPSQGAPVNTSVTGAVSCPWTAISNATWVTITAGSSGSDNGTVSYTVAPNTSSDARTGTITVAGLTFTVTQSGTGALGPLIRIEPTSLTFNLVKGQGQIANTDETKKVEVKVDETGRPKALLEQEREIEGDHVRERMEWFYGQREYGLGRIPERARERAIETRERAIEQLRFSGVAEATEALAAQWTHLGPSVTTSGAWGKVSGRVTSIVIHPTNPNIVYLGGAQGGVWRTTDNGATWIALTDDQPSLAIGALAIDPNNPGVIYAGTGEANFSLDSYYGNGVLKSSNGGVTWSVLGSGTFARQTIGRITISPSNSQVVFAASNAGLYRSVDAGANWSRLVTGTFNDVIAMPGSGSVFYAAQNSGGVFKSTDGGSTWTKLINGLPSSGFGRIQLTISSGSPNTLLAAFTASNAGLEGLYRSSDAGATWLKLTNTPNVYGGQGWYDVSLGIHPTNSNVIYLGGLSLWRTIDGGNTWSNVSNPRDYFLDVHPDQHAFTFNPQNPNVIWLGCDGGVWRSDDAGNSWVSCNEGLSLTQFQTVALHPTNDAQAFGGTQDNGIQKYSGTSAWQETRTGDNGSTYFDSANPSTVFTTYIYGALLKSQSNGDIGSWYSATNGIPVSNGRSDTRQAFYAPFAMDPGNSQKLAYGSYRVWYTVDGMANWSAISGDVTGGGMITTIGFASGSSRIWTGSSDAQVWRGDLSGGSWSWTNTSKSPLPGRYVTRIAPHPSDPQIAYVSYSGFGSDHVFRTADGGSTWTSASAGLPDIPVNVVLVDPNNPTVVYAGTDIGVYRTSDSGLNWAPFGTGLPNAAVFDLAIRKNSNLLRVATHGRGMWEIQVTGEQSFTIFNDGDATLTVTGISKQNNSSWLSYTLQNAIPFDIPPRGSVPVRVAVNGSGLSEGIYSDRFLVTSNDTPRSPYPTGVFINLNVTNSNGGGGCNFSINPTSQTIPATGGSGSVAVTATTGCQWTALPVDQWISITSGATGSGNGTVGFTVAANTGSTSRTGTIKIAGLTFTVTQAGGSSCTFSITPGSNSFTAAGGTGTIGISTQTGCAWTTISNNDWISISSGNAGTGNGTTGYFVAANNTLVSRTGTISVAGQTFTITQAGNSSCIFTLSPTSQFFSSGGGSGSVNVSTSSGCNWTASSSADWVQVISGNRGSGSGTVTFAVAANPSNVPRATTIQIAGQLVIVGQAGIGTTCGLQPISIGQTVTGALTSTDCISPIYGSGYYSDLWYFTAKAGQQVGISLNSNAIDSYLTLLSPDGTIYAYDDDGGGNLNSRIPPSSGFITLAFDGTYLIEASSAFEGQLGGYTLSLFAPTGCGYNISPAARSFTANGGSDTIALTTQSGCPWNATSNASWIVITSGNSGTDSGTVGYTVASNTGTSSRTGTVTIANQTFTVTQTGGSNCTFSISPTSQAFSAAAGSGTVSVNSQTGCVWAARSNADWINITSNPTGSGSGSLTYAITANNGIARTGTITIAGLTFTVNQAASAACTYLLSPTSQTFDYRGGSGSIIVTSPAGCYWTAIPSDPWIALQFGTDSGVGNGFIGYFITANTGSTNRTGTITVGNQVFTIYEASSTAGCPTVTGISPSSGPQGSSVIITGTNLTGTTVKFANQVAATIKASSSTSLTVVVPTGASTGQITVSKAGCPDVLTPIYTVTGDGNCVAVSGGIFGWWPGDGNANDLTGLHNGVLKNGASLTTGFVGQGFQLDGVDDYVDLGGFQPGAQWTLEAWVKPSSVTAGRKAILGGVNGCADWALVMQDGQFAVAIKPASGACTDNVLSGITAVADTWYHLIATNDGSTARLYVNGELRGTGAVSANYLGTSAGTWIGGDVCCTEFFPGVIDEPGIWTRALSASEAKSIFAAGGPGKCRSGIVTCPTVGGISPTSGTVGSTVIITGTGFSNVTSVKFANGITAQFTINSDSQITATVPTGAVTGVITLGKTGCADVTTPGFTVTTPCPTIASISPSSGAVGSNVVITGSNLSGVTAVKFASNLASQFTINSNSQITATVPVGAVSGAITLSKVGCADVLTSSFTVTQAPSCPTVSSINPSSGPAGSVVSIAGTNFTGLTSLKFSNNVTAQFTIISDTQISAIVPTGAVSGVITLSRTGCSDVTTAVFTVVPASSCIDVSISSALTGIGGSTLTVPVMASDTTGKGALSYDATITFDPAVIRPQATPVDKVGTLSAGMTLTLNTSVSGQMRISAFSSSALSGSGVLLYLKFDVIGATGNCSNLTWASFRFNEGTPCATISNGRVCVTGGSLAGLINYCITPKPVPGVRVSANGTPSLAATTGTDGTFRLSGLGGGAYTLSPAKTGDINGITSYDAALVALHVVGTSTLNSCQQLAGDTSNNGSLSSFDAALIAQYVVGIANPANFSGTWVFSPASRSYGAITSDLTGQNFDAVLVGDVSGNWAAGANIASTLMASGFGSRIEAALTTVSLPAIEGVKGTTVNMPITVSDLSGKGVIAFDLDISFDPQALQPFTSPVDATGTLSSAMTITVNATDGRLRISGFGTSALAGAGTLLNLKFNVVGSNTAAAITWQKVVMNEETMSQASLTNGQVMIPRSITSVSAGHYIGVSLAVESIAAGFGYPLATGTDLPVGLPLPTVLAGSSIIVRDSTGTERLAPLFYVAPQQINFLVPAGTSLGQAIITAVSSDGTRSYGAAMIVGVEPAIFTVTQDGRGVPAGFAIHVDSKGTQTREGLNTTDPNSGAPIPKPIDMGPDTDLVILEIYGTGIRKRSSLSAVTATIGGVNAPVEYADLQGWYVGLDQVNIRVPRSLTGRGQVDLVLTVDGRQANTVPISIK